MRKKIDYKHLIEEVCGFRCENDNYGKPLPSLKAQEALNELCDYFLGEDWYEPTGQVHPEIVNFAIVEEIEKRYRGARIRKNRTCGVRNLTDEETAIYESWIENEAEDTDLNIMDGGSE